MRYRTTELRRLERKVHMVQHRLRGLAIEAQELDLQGLQSILTREVETLGAERLALDLLADELADPRGRKRR